MIQKESKMVKARGLVEKVMANEEDTKTIIDGCVSQLMELSNAYYSDMRQLFDTYADVMAALGVTVVSCVDMKHLREMKEDDGMPVHIGVLGVEPVETCKVMLAQVKKEAESEED